MIGLRARGANLNDAEFDGAFLLYPSLDSANLDTADLQWAVIEYGSLRMTNLSGAEFEHALIRGGDMTGATLDGASFVGATIRGTPGVPLRLATASAVETSFEGASLKHVYCARGDLSHANFTGATLRDVDFTGANLEGAIFRDTTLIDVTMPRVRGAGVDLSCDPAAPNPCVTENLHITASQMSGASFVDRTGRNITITNTEMEDAHFTGAHFENFDGRGSTFDGGRFEHSTFLPLSCDDCGFGEQEGAKLDDASFVDADLFGANWERARLLGADFTDATMSAGNFCAVRAQGANFTRADLHCADISWSSFIRSDFTRAELGSADASHAAFFEALLDRTDMGRMLTADTFAGGPEPPIVRNTAAPNGKRADSAAGLHEGRHHNGYDPSEHCRSERAGVPWCSVGPFDVGLPPRRDVIAPPRTAVSSAAGTEGEARTGFSASDVVRSATENAGRAAWSPWEAARGARQSRPSDGSSP